MNAAVEVGMTDNCVSYCLKRIGAPEYMFAIPTFKMMEGYFDVFKFEKEKLEVGDIFLFPIMPTAPFMFTQLIGLKINEDGKTTSRVEMTNYHMAVVEELPPNDVIISHLVCGGVGVGIQTHSIKEFFTHPPERVWRLRRK